MRVAVVTFVVSSLVVLGFLMIAPSGVMAAESCGAATVWADPDVVQYQKIVGDFQDNRSEPNFTVFIELPDGSAGDIDPSSVKLNGMPALEHPSELDDANENGIADLMVKFNRSALITSDGLLRITGRTSDGCFAGEASVEIHCRPTAVERSDYFLDYTTSNMPDPQLNNLPAKLDVRRVRPLFEDGCPDVAPIRAVVLVPGRTIEATAVFDLQFEDYSLMERLAMRGIDTFAVNFLGYGFSSLLNNNPLDNPCNASLPQCDVPVGGTCTPVEGVCDCQNPAIGAKDKTDQQGSTRYLNPNPLLSRCAHTSNTRNGFDRVTNHVAQLDIVIDDVLAKTELNKAYLLGLSAGGPPIGKYLGDDVSHQSKIAGVIFLSSSGFGGTAGQEELSLSHTWPLGLMDSADVMTNFNLAGPTCRAGDGCVSTCTPADPDCAKGLTGCPGQRDPAIQDPIWTTIKARDLIGPGWGPPDGLSRFPIISRFLWNATVASKIEIPALHILGLKDNVIAPARGREIWSSSPLQVPEVTCMSDADCDTPSYACRSFPAPAHCRLNNRILLQLDCASHIPLWETCSGENCASPHRIVQNRVIDWVFTGK